MSKVSYDELKGVVEADPGDPRYVDYARALLDEGNAQDAISTCLRGLSADPTSLKGRLTLSEAFFVQGLVPFAIRELEELTLLMPGNESISKLLHKIDPRHSVLQRQSQPVGAQLNDGVAEEDFSIDDLESLEADPG